MCTRPHRVRCHQLPIDLDDRDDADTLAQFKRAMAPNLRASRVAGEELYGDAVVIFHPSVRDMDQFVPLRRKESSGQAQSVSDRCRAAASSLANNAGRTCSFGSHSIRVSALFVEDSDDEDGSEDAGAQSVDALLFGVYHALPAGQHYNGALVYKMRGTESYFYFSRATRHWVIGPGPLPSTRQIAASAADGEDVSSVAARLERQNGFWAEYAAGTPTESSKFPATFQPDAWNCWTGPLSTSSVVAAAFFFLLLLLLFCWFVCWA